MSIFENTKISIDPSFGREGLDINNHTAYPVWLAADLGDFHEQLFLYPYDNKPITPEWEEAIRRNAFTDLSDIVLQDWKEYRAGEVYDRRPITDDAIKRFAEWEMDPDSWKYGLPQGNLFGYPESIDAIIECVSVMETVPATIQIDSMCAEEQYIVGSISIETVFGTKDQASFDCHFESPEDPLLPIDRLKDLEEWDTVWEVHQYSEPSFLLPNVCHEVNLSPIFRDNLDIIHPLICDAVDGFLYEGPHFQVFKEENKSLVKEEPAEEKKNKKKDLGMER